MEDNQIRNLRHRLQRLVFRRVRSIVVPDEAIGSTVTTFWHTPAEQTEFKETELDRLTEEQWQKNVEQRHTQFYGFTTRSILRDNDSWDKSIFFEKKGFSDFLDPVTLTLDGIESDLTVSPKPGDLLCGEVSNGAYSKWFICSEQFYRAWTLIMYHTHSSFRNAEKKKCGTRSFWMSGNRLMTRNYEKWLLAGKDNGVEPSRKEKQDRYWHQRTESISRLWIHVYCAIVLLARYRELPSADNVPRVKGGATKTSTPVWDLPDGFVEAFLAAY